MFKDYINRYNSAVKTIDQSNLDSLINLVEQKVNKNQTIFTCGNGGSAYNASHVVTDWAKMKLVLNGQRLKVQSLCDNIGTVTAYANDENYENIFSRQLETFAEKNDLLICISGSGNSLNVVNAAMTATKLGCTVVSLVGFTGGKLKEKSDLSIHVRSNDMQIVEDAHIAVAHYVMQKITSYA